MARSVCWRGSAARLPAGQKPEALVEPSRELLCRQRLHPRRAELQGQRDAVEALADLGDRGRVALGEHEVRLQRRCPLDEQLDGRVLLELGQRRQVLRIGYGSDGTRQAISPVSPSASRLVARTCSLGTRAGGHPRVARARVEQVLAIVQHQQHAAAAQARGDGTDDRFAQPSRGRPPRRQRCAARAPDRPAAPAPPARRHPG